jgi:hypothetical protein
MKALPLLMAQDTKMAHMANTANRLLMLSMVSAILSSGFMRSHSKIDR